MAENATSTKLHAEVSEQKSSRKSGKKQPNEASFNLDEIRELAELVDQHGFTDFEFENENIRVRLSKTPAAQIFQTAQVGPAAVSEVKPTAAKNEAKAETPHPGAKAETEAAADESLLKITSPIVGTFYRSPSPDKDSYVQIGSKVSDDTVVCIVEAMKLMNEIQAETSGEIVKIYVENGQPVEYGQPLFGIRK